ncbi:hypothetical protein JMJ77_0015096 [Colletotrichum scovillei]|uniref:Uncharacterized protein n=1 Tax=Colletotrichum scovillei TaxID=1209932 RepID=A0A9P7QZI7_9PEZI|nr:hypothetical protein JMJ77_0015096 [Colletotrichum scovillei]KAG7056718.1 hypothetical protein JMJ78_0000509 [Colletotrichum scovillei]KAG7066645.1 hypothetical protein JMJ76_0000500 [Colletotrichum scovillei]
MTPSFYPTLTSVLHKVRSPFAFLGYSCSCIADLLSVLQSPSPPGSSVGTGMSNTDVVLVPLGLLLFLTIE